MLQDDIRKGFILAEEAEKLSELEDKTKFIDFVDTNYNDYSYNLKWRELKSIRYFLDGLYSDGIKVLMEVYSKYEYNIEFNYNLGTMEYYNGQYEKALSRFIRCISSDKITDDINQGILSIMEQLLPKVEHKAEEIKLEEAVLLKDAHMYFPFKCLSEVEDVIFQFKIKEQDYFVGIYDDYSVQKDGIDFTEDFQELLTLYEVEIAPGNTDKSFLFKFNDDTVIGIMSLEDFQKIEFQTTSYQNVINRQFKKRFYYYRLEKGTQLELKSNSEFVVSRPIPLIHKQGRPKLILNLFIDGFSLYNLDLEELEKLMPNTYNFFQKGTICTESYSNGEWTKPSLASLFTGTRTTEHRIFHRSKSSLNLYDMDLFTEILDREGYNCCRIDGDWRSSAIAGYAKGFQRNLYKRGTRSMHVGEVLLEATDHLEAFNETDNFLWLCIPDLHDITDEYETRIPTQIHASLESRFFKKTSETSVQKTYDTIKIERYKNQMRRVDSILNNLYHYILDHYTEDEYVISLFSDHGQGFLLNSTLNFMDDGRSKVATMFRGRNVPQGICTDLIESIDIFPILFQCAGIEKYDKKFGNVPKWFNGKENREYTISESIHPDCPYICVIRDDIYKYFFTSKDLFDEDGLFDLSKGYDVKVLVKSSLKDVTDEKNALIEYYTDIVLERIKYYLKGA